MLFKVFLHNPFPIQVKFSVPVDTIASCVVFRTQRDDVAESVGFPPVRRSSGYMMVLDPWRSAHHTIGTCIPDRAINQFLDVHAAFILSSWSGVIVSIPSSFASSTVASINRLISAVL